MRFRPRSLEASCRRVGRIEIRDLPLGPVRLPGRQAEDEHTWVIAPTAKIVSPNIRIKRSRLGLKERPRLHQALTCSSSQDAVRLAREERSRSALHCFRGWGSPVQSVQCGAATMANMAVMAIESLYGLLNLQA
jgi:hypothetical protein